MCCQTQGYAAGEYGIGMFWADSVTYGSGDFDAGQVDPTARVRVGSVYVAYNGVYGNALCLMDETLARHAAVVMNMRLSSATTVPMLHRLPQFRQNHNPYWGSFTAVSLWSRSIYGAETQRLILVRRKLMLMPKTLLRDLAAWIVVLV